MVEHLPRRAQWAEGAERLPRRLLASWQRSEDYGVSLESVEPVFSGSYDDESLFFQCGQEVLSGLHKSLASEPISLMLTDAEGLVLNRFSGDHALLRSLDAVHLAPGFSYAEREAGTNGLGLALADRAPTVVRAEEHYSLSLCSYTCAAAPVIDHRTGRLEGSVNLTTWSHASSHLLLALAHSAASNTSALMLARATGHRPRPTPRGTVFRVEAPRLEPGAGTLRDLSHGWTSALHRVEASLAAGKIVAAVGEQGAGRATLVAQAQRRHRPSHRILATSAPSPDDMEPWLELWTPEVGKPHTAVIVQHVDALPVWVAERLRDLVAALSSSGIDNVPIAVTAERFEDIPAPLAGLIEAVVHVPPLRERPEDVEPLARQVALRTRGREIEIAPAARHVLESHAWPGNVAELSEIVRDAALHTDVIELSDLPPQLLSGSRRRLTRIEAFERNEIVRVLTRDDFTMRQAAEELGMSRATLYRKISHLELQVPRSAP